jgi:hypothetical protein
LQWNELFKVNVKQNILFKFFYTLPLSMLMVARVDTEEKIEKVAMFAMFMAHLDILYLS